MGGFGFGSVLPQAVKGLLIANIGVFLVQQFIDSRTIYEVFGLTPVLFWRGALWQPFTYMFIHGGFSHLFFNMLALWMFGGVLESTWGTRAFLKYYFLTGVGAALSNCILTPNAAVPIIGSAGAIYGLLAAYGLMFPNSVIYISFLFPIRAKYLVLISGLFEFITSISTMSGAGTPVAHLVHLGGMVIGVIYLRRDAMLHWLGKKLKNQQSRRRHEQMRRQDEEEMQLRKEVDDLLDKINAVGIGNLTAWEKRRLRQASDRLKRRDAER